MEEGNRGFKLGSDPAVLPVRSPLFRLVRQNGWAHSGDFWRARFSEIELSCSPYGHRVEDFRTVKNFKNKYIDYLNISKALPFTDSSEKVGG